MLADSIEPRFRALILLGAYGGLIFGERVGSAVSALIQFGAASPSPIP